MENSIFFMILLQVVLIGLNAVFACAEIAVISVNDNKLARMAAQGDKRAVRLARLTSQPARFLATIQVAITLSGFLGSAFAADNFSDILVQWLVGIGVQIPVKTLDSLAVIAITLILSYFTLVFGELVPKRVAMRKAEPLALAMSAMISAISKLAAPVVWFLTASTNTILRLIGIDPNAEEEEVGEEEIRMMVDAGSEKGTIDSDERRFIQNVFEFDDLTAGEIATHRMDVVFLRLRDSMDEWKETIYQSRHTRYPVCEDLQDDVVGVLNAKEYFRLEDTGRESVMKHAVRPAYFVPESMKADVLFKNMKHSRNNLAVVLDEYGGMCGIVTMNDLLEQLVGSLDDEEADADGIIPIEEVDENTWKIHGSAMLREISEVLGIGMPCDEYDTFNGLIFDALGRVPEDGTTAEVETAGLSIQILEIEDHQVQQSLVRKLKQE